MSGKSKSASVSGNLALDDSGKGLSITGNAENTIAAKSSLKVEDEIVAATINLGNLDKDDVQNILETLKPYENNMKVLTKKDLSAGVALDSFGLGLKDTTEGLLKNDILLDASADPLAVSFNGLSGGLNAKHGMDGKINGPTLNGDLPKLGLNKPAGDVGATLTMPSIGIPGSDIKADLDSSLQAPDISALASQLNMPNTSLEIDKPDLRTGKYQAPKFKMPNFKLAEMEQPKTEMDISGDIDLLPASRNVDAPKYNPPEFETTSPELALNGPNVDMKSPNIKLEAPNADIEAPSGKFKWPHLKWKSAKVKGPDADLNAEMSVPDINVPTAKVGGDLSGPDVDINLPKADIKGSEVDVETPDLDLNPPSGKINWPHLKWKKPKFHGSKEGLDIDANIDAPDVDLSVPKVKGGLDAPEVDINLPKADMKGPALDVQTPNIDVEAPSGKIDWPHLKWKKPKFHGSKDGLDIDANIDAPDVDLSVPKVKGGLDAPEVDINLPKGDMKCPAFDLPKADLEGPNVNVQTPDIDAPSGKINWPHLKWKKPKLHGPKTELDPSLNAPDVNLSAPKIDGKLKPSDVDLNLPEADIDVGKPDINMDSPSGKIKWPTFKKPKWAISQPKVNGPDIDLDADVSGPDLNLSAPKIDGDIGTPDINLNTPKAEMQSPKLDVNALEADVGPSGKFKWFSFTKNKTLPKADLDVKDIGLKGPEVDLRTADVNLSVPKIDAGIETPDLSISRPDVKAPEGGVNSPDVTLEPGDGKIKLPKVKLPKLKDPKMKEPDMDLNVKVPNADLKAPNVNLKGTHFSLQAPNIEGGLSGPEIDGTNFKTDVNLSLPNPTLNSPDMNISTKDLEAPDVEMKLPKTDANGTSLDLGNADLDLSAPKIDGTLWTPNTDAKLPNAELEAPDLTKKSPNLKINQPKVDLKAPDGQLKMPDLDAHLGDFKMPHFKVPMLDLSSPNAENSTVQDTGKAGIEAPNFNIDSPTADASISSPAIEMNGPKVEGPKVNIKTPDVDGNVEKLKLPHLKLPKFSLSEYKDKSGEVNDTNNEDNDGNSNDDGSNVETAVPLFKFHKLPTRTLDGIGDISEAIGLSKRDRGEKDFVVSKGIRLPISNAPKAIGKIDIMERLKLAKEKTTSVLQTDEKNDADLKLATPSLDVGVSAEIEDSSLVRGGTDLEPGSADDIQKLSLGLSNMLGLKLDDPDAV